MNETEQLRRAEAFRLLHHGPSVLILPNAWDVISARLFEVEGFNAIGTTSAGIAAALGYPDGQQMTLSENLTVCARIAEFVKLPVSIDLEAGYAETTEGVTESARAAWSAGAVGINLEDGTCSGEGPLIDEACQAERIRAIREAASARGRPLFINARTDVFLVGNETPARRLAEAVRRANAYVAAGADGVFVPDTGALDKTAIATLVNETDAPLNVIAGPTMPPIGELQELGVARVSLGPRPMRAALAVVRRIARELLNEGTYTALSSDGLGYAEVNSMLIR